MKSALRTLWRWGLFARWTLAGVLRTTPSPVPPGPALAAMCRMPGGALLPTPVMAGPAVANPARASSPLASPATSNPVTTTPVVTSSAGASSMIKTSVAASPAGPDARPDGLARACPVMDSLVQDPPGTGSPGTGSPGTDSPGTDSPDNPSPGTTGPGTTGPATDSPPADDQAPASTPGAAPAGTATRPTRSLWPARAFRTARLTALGRSVRSGRSARPVDLDAAAEFIQMHRREVPGAGPAGPRLREIRREISLTGTYRHTVD